MPPPPEQSEQRGWGCLTKIGNATIVVVVVIILLIVLGSLMGGRSGGGGGSGESSTDSEPEAKEEAKKKKEPNEKPKEKEDLNPNFSDGTHQVGTDIQPGTYRTREGSQGCYYSRLSGFSSEMDDILANGVTNGPAIVTIESTDAGFQSQRCGTWTQDLSAITESKTSFDEGAYIVNTDIEPGTYRNSGSTGCYYVRLSEFSGGMEDIIANQISDEPTVVTIEPTDAGFQSQRCGTWTRVE